MECARLPDGVGERGRLIMLLGGPPDWPDVPGHLGDVGERARVAVRKAIAAAIGRIAEVDLAVARLLRTTVSTGRTCRYEPDPVRLLCVVQVTDVHRPPRRDGGSSPAVP